MNQVRILSQNLKKSTLLAQLIFSSILCYSNIYGQNEWQQITNPSITEVAANFQTPPFAYGMTQWWGWDGPMNEAVIKRNLDAFKSRGVKIVTIEPGYDMPAPYLSDGWFELIKTAVAEAKQRDMRMRTRLSSSYYPSNQFNFYSCFKSSSVLSNGRRKSNFSGQRAFTNRGGEFPENRK